jgi:hypothetical protein
MITEDLDKKIDPGFTLETDPNYHVPAKDGVDVIPNGQAVLTSNMDLNTKDKTAYGRVHPSDKMKVGLTKGRD